MKKKWKSFSVNSINDMWFFYNLKNLVKIYLVKCMDVFVYGCICL